MKKKKQHYELTNFSGFWWYEKLSKWQKQSKNKGVISSHRSLGTDGRKAWKIFRKFRKKDWVLIKWYGKKGKDGKQWMQIWKWE